MRVLHLVLKRKWYDMIDSGVKTEEYREIKPYWIRRLCLAFSVDGRCHTCIGNHCIECLHKNGNNYETWKFDAVRFHRGYSKITKMFSIKDITIGFGNPEWGAPDKEVFIIKLGKRINGKEY
jgi:hypothetical protein